MLIVTTPSVWCIEDGVLLQRLRQDAKLDDFVFARMNAISLAQLRELEGLGEGSFYNPQIKTATGYKLLRKLGHTPSNSAAEPGLTAASAPPFLSRTPALTATAEHSLPSVQKAPPFRHPANTGIHLKWTAGLLLLSGLAWTLSRMPWPESTRDFSLHEVKSPMAAQASLTSGPSPAWLTTSPAPNAQVPESPVNPTEATASSHEPTAAHCDWQQHPGSHAFEPTEPLKPGNYIHFVAAQDTDVCVRDQKNRLSDVRLKAGSAHSVYGEPPFLVHTPNWQNLQVFFQGRRVQGTPEGAAYWVFKSIELPTR